MVPSTLGQLILGYQLVWNRQRQVAAVQLFIRPHGKDPVEGAHFLRTVNQTWSEHGPDLLLTPETPALLVDLLDHGQTEGPPLVVQHVLLMHDPAVVGSRATGAQRGMQLLYGAAHPAARQRR